MNTPTKRFITFFRVTLGSLFFIDCLVNHFFCLLLFQERLPFHCAMHLLQSKLERQQSEFDQERNW